MKTETELNNDILKITLEIENKFPELSKYIAEIPITIPNINSPEVNTQSLNDYYDSLHVILKNYAQHHQ